MQSLTRADGPRVMSSPPPTTSPESLRTDRESSSIPRGESVPAHQPSGSGQAQRTWTYPSPRQFYDALRKKGFQPDERDMDAVVRIHNSVNERAWSEVLRWERAHCTATCPLKELRLIKFKGRPRDFSFKARVKNALGYKLPFDRHDWTVDRCGTHVRYIIDFYNGSPVPGAPASVYLDVRPAIDSAAAIMSIAYMGFLDAAQYAGLRSTTTTTTTTAPSSATSSPTAAAAAASPSPD